MGKVKSKKKRRVDYSCEAITEFNSICDFLHSIQYRLTEKQFHNLKVSLILGIVKYDVLLGEDDEKEKKQGIKILDDAKYQYCQFF